MHLAFKAGEAGDWAEFLGNDRLSALSSVKLRECCSEVGQVDEDRKSTALLILQKSADFLRRIVESVDGETSSYVCPHCHRYPLEDYIWWV